MRHNLKREVEAAKIRLSDPNIEFTDIYLREQGIQIRLTRSKMEEIVGLLIDLLDKEISSAIRRARESAVPGSPRNNAPESAKKSADEEFKKRIAMVIPVGGPTRMQAFSKIVKNKQALPLVENNDWDPLLCVAEGAARYRSSKPQEVIPYDIYAAVELFDNTFIPFPLVKAGNTVPFVGKTNIIIRRKEMDTIHDNTVHIVEGHDNTNKSLNKIRVAALPGKGNKTLHCSYQFKCFKHFPPPKMDIPVYLDSTFKLEYKITNEQLISCTFKDPQSKEENLNIPSVPMNDLGPVRYTEMNEVEKNIERYAKQELVEADNSMEKLITDLMEEGRKQVPGQINNAELRKRTEMFILKIDPGKFETKYGDIRSQTGSRLQAFKTWDQSKGNNYSSQIAQMEADYARTYSDTKDNRLVLKNIENKILLYRNGK
jgi:molecular chaperone DnaK (HSP70)